MYCGWMRPNLNFFGRVYVRRISGERLNMAWVVQTVTHGAGSVMLQRFFWGETVGNLIQVMGIMKKGQ